MCDSHFPHRVILLESSQNIWRLAHVPRPIFRRGNNYIGTLEWSFLPRSFILAWKQVCFTQIPTQTIFLFAKYFHFSIIRKDNFPESVLLTIGYQSKGVEKVFYSFFAFYTLPIFLLFIDLFVENRPI